VSGHCRKGGREEERCGKIGDESMGRKEKVKDGKGQEEIKKYEERRRTKEDVRRRSRRKR
jgi:hypothetical protein